MLFDAGKYDVIVVGAGHAGCEAALSTSKVGLKTLLITLSLDSIAHLPCNPSIGGTGKGHLVREIDALGGYMGINTDKTMIQSRMLNTSKGPAVHSLRCQVDKVAYQNSMKEHLENTENLFLVMDEVVEIMTEEKRIIGVITKLNAKYYAKAVILTTGVYLDSSIYIGETHFKSGPLGLTGAYGLSKSLINLKLPVRKFKTGTPARVHKDTIDFTKMDIQKGDDDITPFSFMTDKKLENKIDCYLTRTNLKTHEIIKKNISRSAMVRGDMNTKTGARYCPSVEDKVMRFKDKKSHQFFVEPEGLNTKEYYIQGFSSSLPYEVQIQMYKTVAGLENCHMTRPAYAIEYDCIDPLCLDPTLKVNMYEGLYTAGQINSTSGYEEAASQGIIAGINAASFILGREPLILTRDNSYIGVLIDDLVTKGTNEPYRMMTSRAEYRLLLRQDNADQRLTEIGRKYGLVTDERYDRFKKKYQILDEEILRLKKEKVKPDKVNKYLEEIGEDSLKNTISLYDLLKRPKIDYKFLEKIDMANEELSPDIKRRCEIETKYQGYIVKQIKQIESFKKLEDKKLSDNLDYNEISGLRIEARQKLSHIKPKSIGQASRISGVSPADISVLLVYLKTMGKY